MSEIPRDDSDYLRDCTSDFTAIVVQYFERRSTDVATVESLTEYARDRAEGNIEESRIRSRLHHVTLPKLAERALVDYDSRTNTARYRESTQQERMRPPYWVPDTD